MQHFLHDAGKEGGRKAYEVGLGIAVTGGMYEPRGLAERLRPLVIIQPSSRGRFEVMHESTQHRTRKRTHVDELSVLLYQCQSIICFIDSFADRTSPRMRYL